MKGDWQAEIILSQHYVTTFSRLLRGSISDHYPRSCGNVTRSRPRRLATRLRLEQGALRPEVLSFTTAPVRSNLQVTRAFIILDEFKFLPDWITDSGTAIESLKLQISTKSYNGEMVYPLFVFDPILLTFSVNKNLH